MAHFGRTTLIFRGSTVEFKCHIYVFVQYTYVFFSEAQKQVHIVVRATGATNSAKTTKRFLTGIHKVIAKKELSATTNKLSKFCPSNLSSLNWHDGSFCRC